MCRSILCCSYAFAALLIVGTPGFAQSTSGVVVESVSEESIAQHAGLHAGDIVQGWSASGTIEGEVKSPFEFLALETEQGSRGTVALRGVRGSDSSVWTLSPGKWGILVRPNFSEPLLAFYREAGELAKTGQPRQAIERWTQASQLDANQPRWLRAWLLFHAAEVLSGAHEWKDADAVYREAVQQATEISKAIKTQLLVSWADSFAARHDWAHAEMYYQQAVSQYTGAETLAFAHMLEGLGTSAVRRGDLTKAEPYTMRALAMRQRLAPESLDLAASLENVGVLALKHGDLAQAENYHSRARDIRQRLAPGSLELAHSFNNLGLVAQNRGNLAKADDYFHRAMDIRVRLAPNSLDLASSIYSLGHLALNRGDLATAKSDNLQALAIREQLAPGSLDVAASLSFLGSIAHMREDWVQAEEYYRRAIEISGEVAPGSLDLSIGLHNLATVAENRGDLKQAEEYLRPALAIREKFAPSSLEMASCLITLANIIQARGDLSKAARYYRRALRIQEKLAPRSLGVAITLRGLGRSYMARGNLAEAEAYFHRALNIQTNIAPRTPAAAVMLLDLGDVARKRSDLSKAEGFYRGAIAISEETKPGGQLEIEALASLAFIMRRRHQPDAATDLFAQAVDALETQTSHLGGTVDVRSDFRAQRSDLYKDYIDLLMAQHRSELAFQVQERSRARGLLEILAGGHIDVHNGANPELLSHEHTLQDSLRQKLERRVRLLGGKQKQSEVATLTQEIEALHRQYEEVEEQMRLSSPKYAALTQPLPLSAGEVQQRLGDNNTVLLEYSLGKNHSYVWIVSPDSIAGYRLPKRAQIEAVVRPLYRIITGRARERKDEPRRLAIHQRELGRRYDILATSLSRMVLGPVASQLSGKRLVIVSDGALQYIPFALLPEPENVNGSDLGTYKGPVPLVMRHEIVHLPSASVLAELQREGHHKSQANRTIAVLADPVFDKRDERVLAESGPGMLESDKNARNNVERISSFLRLTRSLADLGIRVRGVPYLPRLPYSREEARVILETMPPERATAALDFDANRARAMSPELGQFQVVHFATHALLDDQNPELSGLVLSLVDQHGRPQDGLLDLESIYNLNLHAELVVLSACETGLGKEIEGEGLIGLTRGFMYAGAKRIVASLWNVNDAATAKFMGLFYRAMENGLTPAAALRQAQIEMLKMKPWSDPYYWAAFQIEGEWQ